MNYRFILYFLLLLFAKNTYAQNLPPSFGSEYKNKAFEDNRVRKYITPQRIVWKSDATGKYISGESNLLSKGTGQSELPLRNLCVLRSDGMIKPGIVLDFGKELHGGLQLVTGLMKTHDPVHVRIRFGESVSEAMSDIDSIKGATNDHAMRDFKVALPWRVCWKRVTPVSGLYE